MFQAQKFVPLWTRSLFSRSVSYSSITFVPVIYNIRNKLISSFQDQMENLSFSGNFFCIFQIKSLLRSTILQIPDKFFLYFYPRLHIWITSNSSQHFPAPFQQSRGFDMQKREYLKHSKKTENGM